MSGPKRAVIGMALWLITLLMVSQSNARNGEFYGLLKTTIFVCTLVLIVICLSKLASKKKGTNPYDAGSNKQERHKSWD